MLFGLFRKKNEPLDEQKSTPLPAFETDKAEVGEAFPEFISDPAKLGFNIKCVMTSMESSGLGTMPEMPVYDDEVTVRIEEEPVLFT